MAKRLGAVEEMVSRNPSPELWSGRRVLVTGHTGFKGGWLSLWLHHLGARVAGFALDPPVGPGLCHAIGVADLVGSDIRADLADLDALCAAVAQARPSVVFHLAAQPLVRASYLDPVGTLRTNVLGTAHLLEAVRRCPSVQAVVVVTTDKVYENREWPHPYREPDPLGGHDPYSAGKAAAELVATSYRASFFGPSGHAARIATARAGNVVGGGDWSADRLVPDCLRAFAAGQPVRLRYPDAVRPWQHVIEPIAGYLALAEALCGPDGGRYACAWNFGPGAGGDATVHQVAETLAHQWGDGQVEVEGALGQPHEAGLLRLDTTLARSRLGWLPRWGLARALAETVRWHRAWLAGEDLRALSLSQLRDYQVGAGEGD